MWRLRHSVLSLYEVSDVVPGKSLLARDLIPALDNLSPWAAIRTNPGRAKVVEWLKYLENGAAGHDDPADPMRTYDLGWLWRELQVESLRR